MKLLNKYFELKFKYLECKYFYKREYISTVYQLRIQYLKAKKELWNDKI